MSLGADRVIGDWLVGGAFQYGDNKMEVDDLDHRTDFDVFALALYGGRRFCLAPGNIYLNGGIVGSLYDLESERHDGLGGRYTKDYDGTGFGAFIDAGFAFRIMETFELQPFANVTWSSFWNESFTEDQHGGIGNAQHVKSDHQGNLFSTLGVRTKFEFGYNFAADANIGWRHTYGSTRPTTRMSFSGLGGQYTVQGSALARDEAAYGIGLTYRPVSNVAIRAGYDGSAGSGSVTHRGTVSFALSF